MLHRAEPNSERPPVSRTVPKCIAHPSDMDFDELDPLVKANEPKLLYAEKELLDPTTWKVGNHYHPHHELLVFVRGHQHTKLDDEDLVAGSGEVFFFSAGTMHEEWLLPDERVIKYTLGFTWDVDLSAFSNRISDSKGRITELADWISAEAPNKGDIIPPRSEPLIYGLVNELRRAINSGGKELAERARRIIRNNIKDGLSVEELAGNLGMSRSHFSRRFTKETGITPVEFLRQERMDHARFLLRSTDMVVKEIASAVGVPSEQQLCRMLRQSFGMTTRELRGN